MSIRLMSMVFDKEMKTMRTDKKETVSASAAAFVLIALADHANDEGRSIYPSVEKLCSKTKLSKPTVCKALDALEKEKYIKYVGRSRIETKEYMINVERLESKATLLSSKEGSKATSQNEAEEVKPLGGESKATCPDPSVNRPLINHQVDKEEEKINEAFDVMHKTLFAGTFNEEWWKEMKTAPKKMDGKLLRVTVKDQAMADQVNGRTKAAQKNLAACRFPFAAFVLEVPKETEDAQDM